MFQRNRAERAKGLDGGQDHSGPELGTAAGPGQDAGGQGDGQGDGGPGFSLGFLIWAIVALFAVISLLGLLGDIQGTAGRPRAKRGPGMRVIKQTGDGGQDTGRARVYRVSAGGPGPELGNAGQGLSFARARDAGGQDHGQGRQGLSSARMRQTRL